MELEGATGVVVEAVPEEVVDHVMSFLDASALLASELVCTQWRRIARASPAWRRLALAMPVAGVPQPSFPVELYPLGTPLVRPCLHSTTCTQCLLTHTTTRL
jgi:hypothetical protein